MIVRGVLGIVAVLALTACSAGNDRSAGAESPESTTSSTPEMPVEPSGLPEEPATPTPTPTPTPAFPVAKDGENYAACADGNCEVLIRKAASFTISGERTKATVIDGTLKLTSPTGYVSMSGSGYSSWSNGGPTHTATLKAAKDDTAILILRTN